MHALVNLFSSYGASGAKKLVVRANDKLIVTNELDYLIELNKPRNILEYYILTLCHRVEREIGDHAMTSILLNWCLLCEIRYCTNLNYYHHHSISICIGGIHRASKLLRSDLSAVIKDNGKSLDHAELWCKEIWKHILGTTLSNLSVSILVDKIVSAFIFI